MNSKWVNTSKVKPQYNHYLHSIKCSEYKVGIKFDKEPLAIVKNNYATKTVNANIPYELDTWPKIPLTSFKLNNCFFGVTNIVRKSDNGKLVHSGYGVTFSSSWNFGNDFAKNVVIFDNDNSSSSDAYNRKNNCLVLGDGPTCDIHGNFS